MNKALVIGNGESRSWFKPCHQTITDDEVVTWGCNAIYREGENCVHNLVATDYAMQQEIYDSGWCIENPDYLGIHNAWFSYWNVVPSDVADAMLMGFDIPDNFIHRSENKTKTCVMLEGMLVFAPPAPQQKIVTTNVARSTLDGSLDCPVLVHD